MRHGQVEPSTNSSQNRQLRLLNTSPIDTIELSNKQLRCVWVGCACVWVGPYKLLNLRDAYDGAAHIAHRQPFNRRSDVRFQCTTIWRAGTSKPFLAMRPKNRPTRSLHGNGTCDYCIWVTGLHDTGYRETHMMDSYVQARIHSHNIASHAWQKVRFMFAVDGDSFGGLIFGCAVIWCWIKIKYI